jgi:hypothetical protein
MFLLEQQARKEGWPNYDEHACAQCRARANPQQVVASTMIMYLYLYPGFSVTECIMHSDMMHSDLPMFILLQAAKQKQEEEEAARKKKAEEEAARIRKQQQEEAARKKKAEEEAAMIRKQQEAAEKKKKAEEEKVWCVLNT